jgi:hypothetical protein
MDDDDEEEAVAIGLDGEEDKGVAIESVVEKQRRRVRSKLEGVDCGKSEHKGRGLRWRDGCCCSWSSWNLKVLRDMQLAARMNDLLGVVICSACG